MSTYESLNLTPTAFVVPVGPINLVHAAYQAGKTK